MSEGALVAVNSARRDDQTAVEEGRQAAAQRGLELNQERARSEALEEQVRQLQKSVADLNKKFSREQVRANNAEIEVGILVKRMSEANSEVRRLKRQVG